MRGETLIFRQNDESHLSCMIRRPISETAPIYLSSLVYSQRNRDNYLAGTGKFIILILALNFSLFDCEKMK